MTSNKPNFDPYHKWLGIPPDEQPPNHYRLLGIQSFEKDPEVIATAADRQMAHVKNFSIGSDGPLAQDLLDSLAKAKICLLHPHKKRAYDLKLNKSIEAVQQRNTENPIINTSQVRESVASLPRHVINPRVNASDTSAAIRKKIKNKRHRTRPYFFIFNTLLFLLIVLIVMWQRLEFVSERQSNRLAHNRNSSINQSAAERQSKNSVRKKEDTEPDINVKEPRPKNTRPKNIPRKYEPSSVQADSVLPNKAFDLAADENTTEKSTDDSKPAEQSITINLNNKQIAVPLNDYFPELEEEPRIKILRLEQAGVHYEIVPADGIVACNSRVEIRFPDVPAAKMLISLNDSDKNAALRIYPKLTVSTNAPIPFTMKRIQLMCRKQRKYFSRLNSDLASAKQKKQLLETWISAPPLKPLLTKREWQAQVNALGKQIPQMEKVVQAVQHDLQFLFSLQKFAKQLDNKAELHFITASTNVVP